MVQSNPNHLDPGDARAAPVTGGDRWPHLDLVRGLALGGILVANIRQIALPWDLADAPLAHLSPEWLAWADWLAFDALIDLKFLTIFSLLFGVGFALQMERLTDRGAPSARIYLRRVLLLAGVGILHGLLLYAAEVLFLYAVCGCALWFLRHLAAHTQLRLGLGLLALTVLWSYQIGGTGAVSLRVTAGCAILIVLVSVVLRHQAVSRLLGALLMIVLSAGALVTLPHGPAPPEPSERADFLAAQQQHRAMVQGDLAQAPDEYVARQTRGAAALWPLHRSEFLQMLFYSALLLFWRTLALFLIGAALYRLGALQRVAEPRVRSRLTAALWVGLGLSVIASAARGFEVMGLGVAVWSQLLHQLSALLIAFGLAGWLLGRPIQAARRYVGPRLEAIGRTALSQYVLAQSLVLAAIFEPWGLGLYGKLDGPVLTLLALGWFVVLGELSLRWLRHFRYGPLEWLWRCGTYGRWLPLRDGRAGGS